MLDQLIFSRRNDLTSVDRRLVASLLGDPTAAAFMSVRELALAADVHESGVVRLAKKLGFSGYPEMRGALRNQLTEQAGAALRVARSISEVSDGDVLGQLARQEIDLLSRVGQHIKQQQVQKAADALTKARRVFVWSHGNAGVLAQLMDRRLRRAGFDTREISYEGRELAERLVLVERGDVVLAFAFRNEPAGLEAVLKHAHRVGAPSLLIADMIGATLKTQPTMMLAAPRGQGDKFLTLTVPMLICNALLLTMARNDHGRSIAGLQSLDRLHQDLGLNR
jgi:DNA-binding MurR/RpiR family transcriptional regulator